MDDGELVAVDGALLRRLRRRLRPALTQDGLEERTGLKQTYISKIETGEIRSIPLARLAQLAAAVGVAPADLIAASVDERAGDGGALMIKMRSATVQINDPDAAVFVLSRLSQWERMSPAERASTRADDHDIPDPPVAERRGMDAASGGKGARGPR